MKKLYLLIVLTTVISCKKESIIPIETLTYSNPSSREGEYYSIDTLLYIPFESKSLIAFYNSRNNETVWQSEKNRKTILETLQNCELEGLNPADYNLDKLIEFEKKYTELEESENINYDLLLTYNLQKYLTHVYSGKLNPRKIYQNWDINPKEINTNSILNYALDQDSLRAEIRKYKPHAVTYKKLIDALELIHKFPDEQTPEIVLEDKIIKNQTHPTIKNIKKKLIYWKDLESKDSITDLYDETTFEAVKKFQKRHGLISDGIIGKSTITALNFTKEQRKQQIIANLERWRWFSKPFDENYVLINIPDYSLHVIEKGEIVMTKRIVVGKNKRKTPILNSVLQTIVFNPTWTVPPTILKEDLIPEMLKNRNAMKNKGIGIYDSKNNEVDPLKWDEKRPRGYRYVQKPGYYNSLGVVKINFPNHHSVYLHDTNHRELFERHHRSLSSGCIRVEQPLDLVEHILNSPKQYSKEKIDSIITTQKTLYVGIKKRYAIYQWYWTAWSLDGELYFRNDIYNWDIDLYQQLRK